MILRYLSEMTFRMICSSFSRWRGGSFAQSPDSVVLRISLSLPGLWTAPGTSALILAGELGVLVPLGGLPVFACPCPWPWPCFCPCF